MNESDDRELVDFPWNREETWMAFEQAVRPQVADMLAGNNEALEQVMERMRAAFDRAWPLFDQPLSCSFRTPDLSLPEPDRATVQAAVIDQLAPRVHEWQTRLLHQLMREFVDYELRIWRLEQGRV